LLQLTKIKERESTASVMLRRFKVAFFMLNVF
jgi:hypothetical protein